MIKFFLFIKKIHFVLIFIILEAFAIHYYANSTSYTKAKLITASNYVVGGIYSQISGLNSYLHLKKENAALTARVALLENELDGLRRDGSDPAVPPDSLLFTEDSVAGRRQFAYFPARVINNSIIRQENYITLNRGVEDGLQPDMAVVADRGIAGYVMNCSDHFAVCMSVLNRGFKTSGKIKGTDYFGSVSWDGAGYEYVMLTEIAKYAQIHVGDTVSAGAHDRHGGGLRTEQRDLLRRPGKTAYRHRRTEQRSGDQIPGRRRARNAGKRRFDDFGRCAIKRPNTLQTTKKRCTERWNIRSYSW